MKCDADFNSRPPEYVKGWYKEFIFGYLEPDGVFMLRLLSSNTSDFVCTEVINHLWQAFYTKDFKQLKRKEELDGDPILTEIQRQVSDPVDVSENYDSIRRRTAAFPTPPPTDRTNNSYGLLTTGKPSSRTPLVEGDV
jgi:hypothetical protein